jgi:hypothetical protein
VIAERGGGLDKRALLEKDNRRIYASRRPSVVFCESGNEAAVEFVHENCSDSEHIGIRIPIFKVFVKFCKKSRLRTEKMESQFGGTYSLRIGEHVFGNAQICARAIQPYGLSWVERS